MEHVIKHVIKRTRRTQSACGNRVDARIGKEPVRKLHAVDVDAEITLKGAVNHRKYLRVDKLNQVFSRVAVALARLGGGDFGVLDFKLQRLAVFLKHGDSVLYRIKLLFGKDMNELWTKCIKRSIIDIDADYSEYKHVSNGDDRFCLMPILDAAKSIEHLEAAYYRYRILPNSITHSENYRGYYSSRTVFERIAEYSVKWNFTDKERTMVKSMFANQFVDYAVKCANNPKVNYKTFSAFINDILEDEKKNPIFSDGKIMYMSKVYRRYYKLMMKRHFYRLYQSIKMITKISKMKSKKQRR